jgi:PPOX class probable F420-dependent enzyme
VDEQAMRGLVRAARVGRLATVRADGRPHVVPVCFALSGDVVHSAVDAKPKRLANIEATGVASLLVDDYAEDWARLWWVRVDGRARVVADEAETRRALEALRAKYPQYDEHPLAGPVIALDVDGWAGWSWRG